MKMLSERALLTRVNRKLVKEEQRLHLCRENSKWSNELGRVYATDLKNCVTQKHVCLEGLAMELGVI